MKHDKEWITWNVSLWINNDENTYKHARDLVQRNGRKRAARILFNDLRGEKTPDGAPYRLYAIYKALEGMND